MYKGQLVLGDTSHGSHRHSGLSASSAFAVRLRWTGVTQRGNRREDLFFVISGVAAGVRFNSVTALRVQNTGPEGSKASVAVCRLTHHERAGTMWRFRLWGLGKGVR